ncbi:hypothetical protein RA16_10800 [Levilactobacillus brevis]|nr:hypothetical protein RA16_10800 [Levilactobacillus brevis]
MGIVHEKKGDYTSYRGKYFTRLDRLYWWQTKLVGQKLHLKKITEPEKDKRTLSDEVLSL